MSNRVDFESAQRNREKESVRSRNRPLVRVAIILATIAVITGACLWGVLWWEKRPLARIAASLERNENQSALNSADRFLAGHPNDIRAGILKARALSGLNRHREADALFQRVALQANGFPDDSAALRAWSTSLLHLKQWPRAIALLENLQENHPSDPDILYSLTAARIRTKQFERALESAKQFAAVSGDTDRANVMIGTIHHDRGNRQQALAAWKLVLTGNPEAENLQISAGMFLMMVGEDLLAVGKPKRAAKLLERSIAKRPEADTYSLLGSSYSQIGRRDKAITAWKHALQLEKLHSSARGELANAALQTGRPKQAVSWLLPLTTTGRLDSRSAYLLQRAYVRLKQPAAARRWRDRAKALRDFESDENTITDLLRRSSDPFWTTLLHAYQLSLQKRWEEANVLSERLLKQRPSDALVRDLSVAIRQRGKLPPLSRLTGKQY